MRRSLAIGAAVLIFALVTAVGLTGNQATGSRTIVLKLVLPAEDAKVSVADKPTDGTGLKRDAVHKLAAGKDTVTVTAVWEPNNYTKITRKRKVTVGDKDEIEVDLSKADTKENDDIVVRFVPTPDDVVDEMCKMAKVGKDDIVYDLGCGDGRMVITAVKKFGAKRGVGIELLPKLVQESKEAAKKAGVEDKVQFREGDVLKVEDLSDATVVMLYMGEDINLRLRPILEKTLKPGARVVSHRFTMGDWQPVQKKTVDSSVGYPCDVLLWEIKGKKAEK
jgi:uncharacterized protein (TIGR03000 family)